jgi:hypothetical protein
MCLLSNNKWCNVQPYGGAQRHVRDGRRESEHERASAPRHLGHGRAAFRLPASRADTETAR